MSFYKKLSSKGKWIFSRANRWNLQCKTNCSTWCSMFLNSLWSITCSGIRHLVLILTSRSSMCKWYKQKKMCHFNIGSFLDHHDIHTTYSFMYFWIVSFFRVLILETNGCRRFPVGWWVFCLEEILLFHKSEKYFSFWNRLQTSLN